MSFTITVSNITNSTAHLSWPAGAYPDISSGATPYNAYYINWRVQGDTWPNPPASGILTTNSYTITGLPANTVIEYWGQRGYSSDGINITILENSSPTGTSFTTTSSIPAPAGPTNLVLTSATSSTFVINWDMPSPMDYVNGFNVYLNGALNQTRPNTVGFADIAGLTPATSYNIYVTAFNVDGLESIASNSISPSTQAATNAPAAPQNLSATALTDNSFTLNWDAVPNATNYQIYMNNNLQNSPISTATSFDLTGLTADTLYSMNVYAEADGLISAPSSTLNVTTLSIIYTIPQNIVVSNITTYAATVSWDAIANVDTYEVFVQDVGLFRTNTNSVMILTKGIPLGTNTIKVRTLYPVIGDYSAETVFSVPNNDTEWQGFPIVIDRLASNENSIAFSWQYYNQNPSLVKEFDTQAGLFNQTPEYTGVITDYNTQNDVATGLTSNTPIAVLVDVKGLSNQSLGLGIFNNVYTAPIQVNYPSTSKSDTWVELSWNSVPGAIGYKIVGDTNYTFPTQNINYITHTAETSVRILANPKQSFLIYVQPYNQHQITSSRSVLRTVQANAEPPYNLAVTSLKDTNVTLTWADVEPGNYYIYKNNSFVGQAFTNSFEITGLVGNTEYYFEVKSATSNKSEPFYVTTAPRAPINFQATNISQTNIICSWSASPGATNYNIYNGTQYIGSTTTTSFVIQNLTESTAYDFFVTAGRQQVDNVWVYSNLSTPLSLITFGRPQNLTVSNISHDNLDLSWDGVMGTGTVTYLIYINNTQYGNALPRTTETINIQSLNANTLYYIKMISYDDASPSNYTDVLEVYTKTNAVTNLVSSAQTANTITIDWDTPVGGADSTQEVIFSTNAVEDNTVTVQVTANDTEDTYVETVVITVVA